MATDLAKSAHMYFDNTMDTEFTFGRPINSLIITTTGAVNMSLDGGTNFMALTAGTYQFTTNTYRIVFSGGGTYEGFGLSL